MGCHSSQIRTLLKGSTAYVSQEAWIRNTTLQKNILYDSSLNEHTYNEVIDACALKPDLAMLPAGDQIEIGERVQFLENFAVLDQ